MAATARCKYSKLVIILQVLLSVNADASCARFKFPTLDDHVVTGLENSTVELPFEVHFDKQCLAGENFFLRVTKMTSPPAITCSVLHINGECQESIRPSNCSCPSDNGVYYLNHHLQRSDNLPTVWIWSTDNNIIEDRNITFDVLYPGCIKDLSIVSTLHESTSTSTNQNDSVEVICTYDEGNPPVSARLLDKHGVEMEGSIYSSGQIRYTFPAVGCQDAGLIRCEAPWANHNQTATLLVTCPPEFPISNTSAFSFDAARDAKLSFQVRTHTAEISNCELTQLTSSHRSQDCSRGVHVTGSAPEFTVTVRLDNVRKQDEGQWTLTLTNEVGSGHVDFQLNINESADNEDEYDDADKNSSSNNNTASTEAETSSSVGVNSTVVTIAVVNVATVILVAVVVLIIVSVRRSRRVPQREEPPVRYDVFRRSPAAEVRRTDRPRPREDSHIYDVVQEGSKDYTPLIRPPPAVPSTSADDYLHPTPPRPL